jgi:putative CocE/NonD family hydrolase
VEDPIWEHLNIDGRYDRVDVPTFHIGGWYDCFIGETIRQYEAMKERSKEAGMRRPRLLVGPWTHADFGSTFGDLDFGFGSTGGFLNSRGDLTDRHLSWFDATLKGDESALERTPPVQVFVMGENRWRGYEEWPPPARTPRTGTSAPAGCSPGSRVKPKGSRRSTATIPPIPCRRSAARRSWPPSTAPAPATSGPSRRVPTC